MCLLPSSTHACNGELSRRQAIQNSKESFLQKAVKLKEQQHRVHAFRMSSGQFGAQHIHISITNDLMGAVYEN